MRRSPKILVFAGSTRASALSGKVAAVAAKELALLDADVTLITLADYPLPLYDGDLEAEQGVPENATKLAKLIAANDGVLISTPEYNHALPPVIKNTIDWISRVPSTGTTPYRGKVYAIAGSSDGRIGGARVVMEARDVLAAGLGALVIAERYELSNAQHAFNESGELVDERASKALKNVVAALVDVSRRMADI